MGSTSSTIAGADEDINRLRTFDSLVIQTSSTTTTTMTTATSTNNDHNNTQTPPLTTTPLKNNRETSENYFADNGYNSGSSDAMDEDTQSVQSLTHMEFDLMANKVSLSLSRVLSGHDFSSPLSQAVMMNDHVSSSSSSVVVVVDSMGNMGGQVSEDEKEQQQQQPTFNSRDRKRRNAYHVKKQQHEQQKKLNSMMMTNMKTTEVTSVTTAGELVQPSHHHHHQAFSILEYLLSDFELVMLNVASFLDCRELCYFSRVCKLFRKLEVDNKVYLWQNLFRSHKVNMICLSTNPFHALKSFEESRRFRLEQSRKLRFTCSPPHSPVDDPLRELSAVIGDWKEACLKYVFVKRKIISETHERELLRNLSNQYIIQKQDQNGDIKTQTESRKRFSDEVRESRRTSMKILQSFQDSDEEDDDFGVDWDSDDDQDHKGNNINSSPTMSPSPKDLSTTNNNANNNSGNKLSLSIQMANKISPRVDGVTDSELPNEASASKTLASSSPLASSFFNRMGSMIGSRRKSFDSPNVEQEVVHNENMELEDFGGAHINERGSSSSEDSSTWESDSDDDTDTVIILPTPVKQPVDRSMSISAITLDFDTDLPLEGTLYSSDASDGVPSTTKTNASGNKSSLLQKFNDDDDDSDDDFLPNDTGINFDSDDSWNLSDKDEKEEAVAPAKVPIVNSKNRLAAFCDDDDTDASDDFGEIKDADESDIGEGGAFGESFVKQEVIEQETLTVDDLITCLTNETRMKETYLSLSNAQTQKFHSQLFSLGQKTKMDEHLSVMSDTMPEVTMEPSDWPTTLAFYNEKKGHGVKVKIIFLEAVQTPNPAKFCHPLVTQFGSTLEQFDNLYPALIIGPWLLHWNPSHSLVVPRKMTSNLMKVQARIHKIAEMFSYNLDNVVEVVGPEIVKWNTSVIHNLQSSNGIHFIDRIMTVLGLGDVLKRNRIGNTLYNYIELAREKGRAGPTFDVNASDDCYSFLRTSPSERFIRQFTTHQELDQFTRQLIEHDPSYTVVRCEDYSLLLMFDLAFWCKHQLFPDHPQYKPLRKDILRMSEEERKSVTCSTTLLCPCGCPPSIT